MQHFCEEFERLQKSVQRSNSVGKFWLHVMYLFVIIFCTILSFIYACIRIYIYLSTHVANYSIHLSLCIDIV